VTVTSRIEVRVLASGLEPGRAPVHVVAALIVGIR